MHLFAQQPIPDFTLGKFVVLMLAALMTFCFVCVWLFLANRATQTKSILPRYEPRRPVPWTGLDVMAIVLFYMFVSLGIQGALHLSQKIAAKRAAEEVKAEQPKAKQAEEVKKTTAHPLAQLLKDKDPKILILCLAVGVVIVPVFEEFFFRLIFTGWLFSVERQLRHKWPQHFRSRALLAIHLSSSIFAVLHFRTESGEIQESNLVLSMSILAVISILTMVFAIVWIDARHKVSARDFGWDASKWREDLWTGAIAYFAIAMPMYVVIYGLAHILPEWIAPDPIVLYFFAVVLGTLYFRTSRLLPSIVLHMMLNAGSLTLAWLLI